MKNSFTKLVNAVSAASICAATLLCSGARAEWPYVDLHPAGATFSIATSIDGNTQVGWALFGGPSRATMWQGTAASYVDLHPAGATSSTVSDVYGSSQVGSVEWGTTYHAGLWSGTAGSYIDLHPAGVNSSFGRAVYEGYQVGEAYLPVTNGGNAGLWNGGAGNFQVLPRGAQYTYAAAVDIFENQVVGDRHTLQTNYGCLWDLDAGTVVNLDPGTGQDLYMRGVHGDRQISTTQLHNGTAPAVSLVPIGLWDSVQVKGIFDGRQVGDLKEEFTSFARAAIWTGTRSSYRYISSAESSALGVYDDTVNTYVVGVRAGRATMWIGPTAYVLPDSLTVVRGRPVGGSMSDLNRSDDQRFIVGPGVVLSTAQSPIELIIEGTSAVAEPIWLDLSIESRGDTAIVQEASLFNFDTGQYELFPAHALHPQDRTKQFDGTGTLGKYVQDGDNKVRARLRFKAVGPVLAYPWRINIDKCVWVIPNY